MKFAVKTKPERTDVYTIRIPVSLKQQMEATRKLADECDADYNATLIGVLANFNANMQAQLSKSRSKGTRASVNGSTSRSSDASVSNA